MPLRPLARVIVRLAAAIAMIVAVVTATASTALALHTESDPATRVTLGDSHTHTGGRHWSTRGLAFSSDVDLLNNGSTGRQIYIFDLLAYDCNRFSTQPGTPCPRPRRPSLVQVTQGPGAPDNPTLVFTEDSQFIAFDADGSFNGGGGPGVGHRQIFLEDLITGEIVRVTNASDGDSVRPQINAGGTIVAFESTAALKGHTELAGIPQVFAYRRQFKLRIGTLIQLTTGRGPSLHPVPNRGGDQLVFQSSANVFGDNMDLGVFQIVYASIDWLHAQFSMLPLTNGNASSIRPYISAKNDIAVFESTATSFGAAAVGPGNEIYTVPTNQGPLPPITQITTQDPYGDCSFPAYNEFADGLAFLCTGDPMQNGTTGNRAFVLSLGGPLGADILHQITGRGDVKGPVGLYMGRNFLTVADNSDLAGTGFCDYQLFIVDFFKDPKTGREFWHAATQLQDLPDDLIPAPPPPPPPDTNVLGKHTFALNSGTPAHASQLAMTMEGSTAAVEITDVGQIRLEIGARDFDDEASVTVLTDNLATVIPPTELPGVGTICVAPTGDPGAGVIDCNGGRLEGDELLQQFHGNDPANPGCVGGCFEVRTGTTCRGPHVGVCRGPITTQRSGFFSPGELLMSFPVKVSLSTFTGFDGIPCTADDDYTITDVPVDMHFTTGNLSTTIVHADAGSNILTTSATGIPFDCDRLAMNDLQGARLVGMFPLLDVPYIDGTLSDLILTYRLEPTKDTAHGACNPIICSMPSDCDDGDPNNGSEDCQNRTCIPGEPPCDDGNPCNGIATKDPTTGGCVPGTPPDCGDGDLCTTDLCSGTVGCIHTPTCDDHNACNGPETCDPTTGTCGHGAPLSCNDGNPCTDDSCNPALGCVHVPTTRCDDGDACNGDETCDPANGACGPGTPPDCEDQNPCTTDSCNGAVGCVHGSKCDDGNACNGSETCDVSTGVCGPGTPRDCDDDNLCTVDSCSAISGCVHASKCDDGNACNGLETCDPSNGGCGPGTAPNCDDHNACTLDSCSQASGCVHTVNCDDGNACTDDTCSPTLGCQHTSNAGHCNDGNPCTDDTCDVASGGCRHTNNSKSCNDGSACTTGDVCQDGACRGSSLCDDGDVCNGVETCDSGSAVCHDVTPPIPFIFYFSCELNQLAFALDPVVTALENAPPASVGGKFRQHSLILRLQTAQRKLLVFVPNLKNAAFSMSSARRKLASFTKSVRFGMLTGHIEADIGDSSLQTVTAVLVKIDKLKAQLP